MMSQLMLSNSSQAHSCCMWMTEFLLLLDIRGMTRRIAVDWSITLSIFVLILSTDRSLLHFDYSSKKNWFLMRKTHRRADLVDLCLIHYSFSDCFRFTHSRKDHRFLIATTRSRLPTCTSRRLSVHTRQRSFGRKSSSRRTLPSRWRRSKNIWSIGLSTRLAIFLRFVLTLLGMRLGTSDSLLFEKCWP